MPVELPLSSECRANPSLPSDVRAFASSLAGFIERASARYQGTHHLRPDSPCHRGSEVNEVKAKCGEDHPPLGDGIGGNGSAETLQPSAADAASTEGLTCQGQSAVEEDTGASTPKAPVEPPRPRWGSRTITKILERRRRAEEGRGASWCRALPHDAVPGPLVAALLDEWLPARAVAATDAQVFAAADRLEVLQPTAAAMMHIGQQKGAIHVDSLTIKMAGTELTYDTLRAAAVYLPQVTSLTISNGGPLPGKLGKHLCVFPCLKHLVLELCDVMDSHLLHVWGCEKLESVSIGATRFRQSVTHRKVGYIARCPALTSLHDERFIRGTSGAEVINLLVQHSPALTSLGLNCYNLMDTARTAITQLTSLRSLSLAWWKYTDALVSQLAQCPVLESLDLVDVDRLSNSGMAQLFELSALTRLRLEGLTLRDCTLEGALANSTTVPSALQILDMSGSWGSVTDAGVRAVLRRCPAVRHITAQECRPSAGLEAELRARGVTLTRRD